jgi:hypothetical protein
MLFKGTDAAYYEMCINERNGKKRNIFLYSWPDTVKSLKPNSVHIDNQYEDIKISLYLSKH